MDTINFVLKTDDGRIISGFGNILKAEVTYNTETSYAGIHGKDIAVWQHSNPTMEFSVSLLTSKEGQDTYLEVFDYEKLLQQNKHLKEVNKQLNSIINEYT